MQKTWIMFEDLPDSWYGHVYHEVRQGRTLRELRALMMEHGCLWSIAAWSKYERGLLNLNLVARNALRSYRDEQPLPPPPGWLVSQFPVEQVVQLVEQPSVLILDSRSPLGRRETEVTQSERRRSPRLGITVCREVGERLNRLRAARGQTWDEFLMGLLESKEMSDG